MSAAPYLPDLSAWPFAPGEGPFRIKGTAYRGHLEYVAADVPGGVPRMLESFDDPRLADFFRQQFLAASFYDILPLVLAAQPCAQAVGCTAEQFVDRRSRVQAPKDMAGVYRFLLAMVPTRSVARRIPQLVSQLLDFGRAEVLRESAGEADACLHGVPVPIAPWFGTVTAAYGEAALRTSGAKRASVVMRPGLPEGSRHAVPVVRAVIEARWS